VLGGTGAALIWLLLSVTGAITSPPFTRLLSGGGLLLGLLAVIAAAVALRRATRPAASLVEAARRVQDGDYSTRVPVRGPGELRTLARAFNAMSGRLEADEARRRSVVADVAHELRTPITVIRAQAEGIVDGVYPADAEHLHAVLAATRALEVLVDDLATLTLAETGDLRLRREPVELNGLVLTTLASLSDVASAAGVRLRGDVQPPSLLADVDPVRMGSALANLVSNALHHSRAGGEISVTAAATDHGVVITVHDDGEGIPAELLPRVFERFVKGPRSQGSGLGLAIVRDIVEAHGGTVSITSQPGAGTTATITLR
jgi:two-component system sensor histidine kinase BaeS